MTNYSATATLETRSKSSEQFTGVYYKCGIRFQLKDKCEIYKNPNAKRVGVLQDSVCVLLANA